jgi:hypothetical protein
MTTNILLWGQVMGWRKKYVHYEAIPKLLMWFFFFKKSQELKVWIKFTKSSLMLLSHAHSFHETRVSFDHGLRPDIQGFVLYIIFRFNFSRFWDPRTQKFSHLLESVTFFFTKATTHNDGIQTWWLYYYVQNQCGWNNELSGWIETMWINRRNGEKAWVSCYSYLLKELGRHHKEMQGKTDIFR